MADLSYTVAVSGHEDLPKLAAGITAVATALGNGKDIAKKLAEFKAAMGGMGGSLDGLNKFEEKLEHIKQTIGGLSDTLQREMKEMRAVASAGAAGISAELAKMSAAPKQVLQIPVPKAQDIGQVKQMSSAFQKLTIDGNNVHSMARGLASGFNLLWLTWGNLVPLFAGAAISNGFVQTVKMGSQVGHTLKIIEVLGENTTKEMAGLNDELLRMGHSGPFGPLEVAEAMKTLSLAGLKVNEILAVTPDVLNFSIAGTTDLKTAADTLVSVSTAFGMGAGGFGRVSDVISKAAADSKSSVESFSSAMKTASVINKQYGVSLEDTATGIAALSQLGIEGSAAGTALRNAYADLSGRSIQVAKVLKQQGIEMRTATGEFRPMIEVVAELDKKLRSMDGISQKNLLQSIASERGAKAIIELLELVRTQAKDTSKTLGNALEEMRAGIEESYGFAAISAAKLSQTTESQFKAVKATLQTSMVQAFKDAEPELLLISDRLKKTLSSPEFIADLSAIVTFVAKAIASFISFGSALVDHAALVVGLAGGYKILQAALVSKTAATVADTSATLANNAAKAGGLGLMGGLARLLPGIGTAITVAAVAWSLYDMWQGRSVDTSAKADELYNNNIIKNLQDEALRLKTLNDLRATGLSLTEAQAQMDANKKQGDSSKLGQTGYARARQEEEKAWKTVETMKAKNIRFMQNPDGFGYVELDYFIKKAEEKTNVATAAWRLATQNIAATAAAAEQVKEENKRSAQITAGEVKQRKDAITGLFGDIKYGLDDKPRGANSRTQKPRSYDEQTLPNLQKQMDSELSVIKARFDSEKAIQDSEYKNLLVTQGQYQANLLASTVTFEQDSIAVIEKSSANYVSAYVEQYAEIKKVRDGFKPDSENWKAEDAKLEALRNKATTDIQANQDKIEKIKLDSNKRQLLAAQDLAGETRKLIKADEEYWTKSKLETDKIESMQKVAEQYRNINTSVFSNATALKAEAEAIAESKAQHEGQLQNMRKEIELRMDAIAALETQIELEKERATYTGNNAVWQELSKAKGLNAEELAKLKARYSKSAEEGITDGARRGALAYQKEMEAKASAVTDSIAGAIETAIFKSGKEGGKALRDYLQAELVRKPLMAIVKAIIQPISSMIVGGLAGGAASAAAGQAGGSALGSAGGSLMGSALGGIGAFGTGASYGATSLFANGLTGTLAAGGQMIGAGSVMSGLGTIAGALGPIALGIAALSSLIKKSTPHTGGIGAYSAASGATTGSSVGLAFGIDQKHYTQAGEDLSTNVAKSIVGILDATATTFGKQAGYYAATAFADDSSKDGAWGALRIKFGEKVLLDWADTAVRDANVPREFADGEAGQKQYLAAVAASARDALVTAIGDVDWATDMLKGLGDTVSLESLTQTVQQINAAKAAFAALGKNIVGFGALTDGAISQLIKAAGSIDGLVSAASAYYDNFYSEAEKTANVTRDVAAALADVGLQMPTTRDEFRALVDSQLKLGESGATAVAALLGVSGAFASVTAASETAAETAARLADEQGKAAARAAEEAARRAEEVARERTGLESQLLQLLGNTTALRERELAALDASNQSLQNRIWAIEDAKAAEDAARGAIDTAFSALERAVSAEKDAINKQLQAQQDGYQAQIDAAQEAADTIRSIAAALANAMKSTQIVTDQYDFMRYKAATTTISSAASTGNLQYAGLEDALGVAGQDSKKFYGRFEDYAFDQGVLAGNVGKLNDQAQGQLTTAEKTLQALKDQMRASSESAAAQLSALDAQLLEQKNLVDAALGIDNTVLTVEQAVQNVADAIRELAAAQAATAIAKAQGSSAGGGGGGGGGAMGGNGFGLTDAADYSRTAFAQGMDITAEQLMRFGGSESDYAAWKEFNNGGRQDYANQRLNLSREDRLEMRKISTDNAAAAQGIDPRILQLRNGMSNVSADWGLIERALSANRGTTFEQLQQVLGGSGFSTERSLNEALAKAGIYVPGFNATGPTEADELENVRNQVAYYSSMRNASNSAEIDAILANLRQYPGFASGGYHAGGLRIVGENGPELEATGASRIWNAADTQRMLSAGGNGDMVAELRALRAEVAELKSTNAAIAGHTAATHRQLVRIAPNDIVQTEVAA